MANYSNRLEKLETVVFADERKRLEIWQAMVTWLFWVRPYSEDEWEVEFDALPQFHPARAAYDSLHNWTAAFADVLIRKDDDDDDDDDLEDDDTWNRRVITAFHALLHHAIDDLGMTPAQLATVEEMREAITVLNKILNDEEWKDWWGDFYEHEAERKRQEQEQKEKEELRRRYRGLTHWSELTPEAAAWLREHDADFLENMRMKLDKPDLDSLIAYLSANARPPDTPAAAAARIAPRIEQLYIPPAPPAPDPAPPPAPAPSESNGHRIGAMWSGVDQGWLIDTVDGVLPVYRGRVYHFSPQKWAEMQTNDYYAGRWREYRGG